MAGLHRDGVLVRGAFSRLAVLPAVALRRALMAVACYGGSLMRRGYEGFRRYREGRRVLRERIEMALNWWWIVTTRGVLRGWAGVCRRPLTREQTGNIERAMVFVRGRAEVGVMMAVCTALHANLRRMEGRMEGGNTTTTTPCEDPNVWRRITTGFFTETTKRILNNWRVYAHRLKGVRIFNQQNATRRAITKFIEFTHQR